MNTEQSIVIAGHGWPVCLMAAAIVALHECRLHRESGRLTATRHESIEMQMCSKGALADRLQALVDDGKVPARLHLVGIGISDNREQLIRALQALKQAGCRCFWLSNQDADAPRQLDGLIEPIIEYDADLCDLAARHFAPWGEYEATVNQLCAYENSAILQSIYDTVGFVNRMMRRGHGQKVLGLFLESLLTRTLKTETSPALRQYIDAWRLMGHRELKGHSAPMEELKQLIWRAAAVEGLRIMILGETGTGKESVANMVHLNSPRWTARFLAYNCASSNSQLQESAFRGYHKGAFTGASAYHAGLFEQADGGTLFLDEVGDLSPESQGVLLRILEENKVMPMGGDKEIAVNVRLITATNKDLWQMVEEGRFREDLLYRLQEFTLRPPALRDIPSDLPGIADAMWRQMAGRKLPKAAEGVLLTHDWPGNARELLNFLKYAHAMGGEDWVAYMKQHRSLRRRPRNVEKEGPVRLDEHTSWHCKRILEQCGGNVSRAADLLGIQRPTLRSHLKKDFSRNDSH